MSGDMAPIWQYRCPVTDHTVEIYDPDDGGVQLRVIDQSGSYNGTIYIEPEWAIALRDVLDTLVGHGGQS